MEAAELIQAPDPPEVRRIAAMRDPILRNLEITQCYWRLARAVAARTGVGANWCTFATWASKQAGSTIRGEDAEALLRIRLGRRAEFLHPIQSLWRWLLRRGLLDPSSRLGRIVGELHTPFDALERASDAVARGNRKVFEEIGLEFARFLQECPADTPVESPEVQAFIASLKAGEPPDGQQYLRQAFERYQRQSAATDTGARAQLLLTANLEIGLHEQTRLQPEILEALDAAYAGQGELGRRILDALLPHGSRARRATPDRAAAAVLDITARRIQRHGAELARSVITRSLMVLSMPGRVLWLGAHLADPYPQALEAITDEDLEVLVARFEPVAPAADDCGAHDWSVLHQRPRSWRASPRGRSPKETSDPAAEDHAAVGTGTLVRTALNSAAPASTGATLMAKNAHVPPSSTTFAAADTIGPAWRLTTPGGRLACHGVPPFRADERVRLERGAIRGHRGAA